MKSELNTLIWKQLFLPLVVLGSILIIGFMGYIFLEGYSPLESIYMLIITFTTIGYGEIKPLSNEGRLFNIVLILSGFTAGVYSLSRLSAFILDGEFSKLLKRKAMNKLLLNLKDHYIVCGYGKTGRKIIDDLLSKNLKVVLIENDSERVERIKEVFDSNLIHVLGDATHDETLLQSGILNAKILISVLTTDAENLFVTLSAKDLAKNIKVITRVDDLNSTAKFKKAGADFIISPIDIATDRIISIATTSTDFLSFVEFAGGQDELKDYKFELIEIHAKSDLVGKSFRDANIPQRTNLVVIGYYSMTNELTINPKASHMINLGDRLLVFGLDQQIKQLRDIAM
jgi:voltage-gated potassium channel